ncbi:MAG: hypothetical protein H7Y59_19195 [Anaerolineales bacterium]|nr:hypothetical protein [Anaerolineales bacterium]
MEQEQFLYYSTNLATIFSVILTVLSVIATVYLQRLKTEEKLVGTKNTLTVEGERDHLTNRMIEAKAILQKLKKQAQTSKNLNSYLIIAQFVVGTTLASSFIQQSLPSFVIGILGVVVLVSTVFRQQFRPDVQFSIANAKAQYLEIEIRNVEDEDYKRKRGDANAPTDSKIISMISKALNKVTKDEEWEQYVKTSETTKPVADK